MKRPLHDDDNYNKGVNLLMEWFDQNPDLGNELLSEAYKNKAEIFMNTIRDKESLYRVMRSGTDLSELAEVARKAAALAHKTEITQDTLVSLGVTSLEELEEALKDKDILALFTHTSTPNADLFIYVQGLIDRAKRNIIDHLRTLEEYDCNHLEDLATTVIGGIKRMDSRCM